MSSTIITTSTTTTSPSNRTRGANDPRRFRSHLGSRSHAGQRRGLPSQQFGAPPGSGQAPASAAPPRVRCAMLGSGIDGCSDAGGSGGHSGGDTDMDVDGTDEESDSSIGEGSSVEDDSDEQHREDSNPSDSDDPSADQDESDEQRGEDSSASDSDKPSADRGADSSSDDPSSTSSSNVETSSDSGMTTDSEMSTWEEHRERHGELHNCGRCRYKRNVHRWRREFVFETRSGDRRSWLEQKRGGAGPWAIGCRVCRLAGMKSKWARTDFCGDKVGPCMLRAHARSRPHARAVDLLLKGADEDAEVAALCAAEDRCDVPGFAMCFAAYKGALKGASFVDYTEDSAAPQRGRQ